MALRSGEREGYIIRLGVRLGPFYASTSTGRRRRNNGNGCLIALAIILWPVTLAVLLVWVIALAVKAIAAAVERRQRRRQQTRALEAATRVEILRSLETSRDEALAKCLPTGVQRDAIAGWFKYAISAADDFTRTKSPEAYARYEQAKSALNLWEDPPTQQCTSCGAPEQLVGYPCLSCQTIAPAH